MSEGIAQTLLELHQLGAVAVVLGSLFHLPLHFVCLDAGINLSRLTNKIT